MIKVPIQSVTVREREKLKKKLDVEETSTSKEKTTGKEKEDLVEVVFVVNENHAEVKPVKLGISDDTHYEVVSGLQEGEKVITGPFKILSTLLQDGDRVTIKKEKKSK